MYVAYGRFGTWCGIYLQFVLRQERLAQLEFGLSGALDGCPTIEYSGKSIVGQKVNFRNYCALTARKHIKIDADCMIAELASIRDHDQDSKSMTGVCLEQGLICAPAPIVRNVAGLAAM